MRERRKWIFNRWIWLLGGVLASLLGGLFFLCIHSGDSLAAMGSTDDGAATEEAREPAEEIEADPWQTDEPGEDVDTGEPEGEAPPEDGEHREEDSERAPPEEDTEQGQSGGGDGQSVDEDENQELGPAEESREQTPPEDQGEPEEDIHQEPGESLADTRGPEEENEEPRIVRAITAPEELGTWVNYNGIVFGDATIYESQSGGGLAVAGGMRVNRNYTVGSTHTSVYDPTRHIGEYKNEGNYPAFLLGGNRLEVGAGVTDLEVLGGDVTMTPEMQEQNGALSPGFTAGEGFGYSAVEGDVLTGWFDAQYRHALDTSRLMLEANDVTITVAQMSSGAYLEQGPEHYRNRTFAVGGEVYDKALFITVRTGSDADFGQWWPVHSVITVDVNWAIEYDLVVFNFPDAVNVTMNSSAFHIRNMEHWSTTVDAWVGERGMEERLALSGKVVYNFPNAETIEANQSLIQGTILAPEATFTGIGAGDAGHIYGHIIVENYVAQGNFTIHAFFITHWLYDIVEDTVNGQRDTASILLRHYLYFHGDPTSIRVSGGGFVVENGDGQFYDGGGGFSDNLDDGAVYTTQMGEYTRIQGIPLGEYTVRNIEPPQGFRLNDRDEDNPHTYAEYPVRLTAAGQTVQAVRYAEPLFTDVSFRKVDSHTRAGLPGARFAIVREADEYEDATVGSEYVSGEDGSFTSHNLPVGTYHLLEVEPPEGYELLESGEYRFSVFWDPDTQSLRVRNERGEILPATPERPIELENVAGSSVNAVVIVKYAHHEDPDASYVLPGAAFALYRYQEEADSWLPVEEDESGGPIDIVTNALGYCRLDNLGQGRYRIVETRAPQGYQLLNAMEDPDHPDVFPEGYAYEFSFGRMRPAYTAYIPNVPLSTDIRVGVEGPLTGSPVPLQGAGLRLEHRLDDGQTWEELVYSRESNEDGEAVFEGLTEGVYRLTQLYSAKGYRIPQPATVAFSIRFDGQGRPLCEAEHDGSPVTGDSAPVRLDDGEETRFVIHNEAKIREFSVYKVDGDYTVGEDSQGAPAYTATYLEGAVFRLQRRATTREPWQDYGDAFVSELLYDGEGRPVLDDYGNHIAEAVLPEGLLYGDYHLVEVESPEGYVPHSSLEVTLNDGTTGMQIRLFSVTEAMTGIDASTNYLVMDYAVDYTTRLAFRKVDATDRSCGLAGAEFALYSCDRDHIHDADATAGSCWAANTPALAASDRDGMVVFDDVMSRSYLLKETAAPPGYRLPRAPWRIDVDAPGDAFAILPEGGGDPPVFVDMGEGALPLLPNHPSPVLPHTGGGGARGLMGAGIGLLAIGAGLLTIKTIRRKR